MTTPGRDTATWRKLRLQCFKRDKAANARCWLCGGAIDYSAKPSTTPDSWEPDHLIPVARAPELELDLSNIAASHMRCNRARGDGINGENALGQQSRIW